MTGLELTDPSTCLPCALATAVQQYRHRCAREIRFVDGRRHGCLCPWCPPDPDRP